MHRRRIAVVRVALLLIDGAVAVAVFVAASRFRFGDLWDVVWSGMGVPLWVFALAFGALWMGAEWLMELDRLRARWSLLTELQDVVRAMTMVAVVVFSALFLLHLPEVSRQFLLVLFVAQGAVAFAERPLLRAVLAALRHLDVGTRKVLVVGTGRRAHVLANRLERQHELGLKLIGHLGEGSGGSRPVVGTVDDIQSVMHSRAVDILALAPDDDDLDLLDALLALGLEEGKIVYVPLEIGAEHADRGRVERLEGESILVLAESPERVIGLLGKRFLDILIAITALVVFSPFVLVIALAIRLGDGGPVFFRQTRVGLHGRAFGMLKFRSMVVDAEARLAEIAALNEIQGPAFKVQGDPRITRIGAFLRRTSLDELPQVWNVLFGQMSIVGPRPPLPDEVATYDLWHRRRLSMKPGITGLWQVSARLEADFDRWVELDLSYIDRWSLWLDVKILARTVPAMLSGR